MSGRRLGRDRIINTTEAGQKICGSKEQKSPIPSQFSLQPVRIDFGQSISYSGTTNPLPLRYPNISATPRVLPRLVLM